MRVGFLSPRGPSLLHAENDERALGLGREIESTRDCPWRRNLLRCRIGGVDQGLRR